MTKRAHVQYTARMLDDDALSNLPLSNDPRVALASFQTASSTLPVSVFPIPASGEIEGDVHETDRIFVAQSGQGRRTYWYGARRRDLLTAPTMIEVYGAGTEFSRSRWEGQPGRCVLVEFKRSAVHALSNGDIQSLRLPTQHEVFDQRISSLAFALAADALAGSPDGALYSEGLGLALVATLASKYRANRSSSVEVRGRFSASQCDRLKQFVDSEIASKLSVTRMAAEVELSPHHFIRVFKASFGATPHQFVQLRRIELAAASLRCSAEQSIAEVAVQYGFANQAHMTTLMRQHLSMTPAMLRRRIGALSSD